MIVEIIGKVLFTLPEIWFSPDNNRIYDQCEQGHRTTPVIVILAVFFFQQPLSGSSSLQNCGFTKLTKIKIIIMITAILLFIIRLCACVPCSFYLQTLYVNRWVLQPGDSRWRGVTLIHGWLLPRAPADLKSWWWWRPSGQRGSRDGPPPPFPTGLDLIVLLVLFLLWYGEK